MRFASTDSVHFFTRFLQNVVKGLCYYFDSLLYPTTFHLLQPVEMEPLLVFLLRRNYVDEEYPSGEGSTPQRMRKTNIAKWTDKTKLNLKLGQPSIAKSILSILIDVTYARTDAAGGNTRNELSHSCFACFIASLVESSCA